MIVTVNQHADPEQVQAELQGLGLWAQRLDSHNGPATLLIAPYSANVTIATLLSVPGVKDVHAARSARPRLDERVDQAASVGTTVIGPGALPVLMAGPCSVESEEQIQRTAIMVRAAGGTMLRGGAYKPRTSPYQFDGHGEVALGWLRTAADAHGLGVVTEAMSELRLSGH